MVLEIYRITLLSNKCSIRNYIYWGFGDLQNYTTLKRIAYTSKLSLSFGDLQNYTTLKPQIRVWGSKATRATTRCNSVNTLNQTKIFI